MPQDNDKLKKVANAASKVGKSLVAPDDDLARELFETEQSNATGRKALGIPEDTDTEKIGSDYAPSPSQQDKLNPQGRYGDRPGERRINVEEMTKPLGKIGTLTPRPGVLGRLLSPEVLARIPGTPEERAARASRTSDVSLIRSYDGGGDVKGDQVALVHDGEKVLTPEQSDAYDAAQGTLSDGKAKFGSPDFSYKNATQDLIQQDKENAAKSGDLVGLGKALINEKHFGQPDFDYSTASKSVSGPLGKINLSSSGNAESDTLVAPKAQDAELSSLNHKDRLAYYDKQIQNALDKGAATNDPAYQEQADRLRLAKLEYQKQTPWGSEGNHPGVLGKIGHVLGKIGNVAGDVLAPNLTAMIPGSELNMTVRGGNLGEAITKDTETNIAQQAEQSKAKLAELGKTPEQQTYNWLLKQTDPATGKLFTPEKALEMTKGDEAKEKEAYINDQMTQINPTSGKNFNRSEATQNYYQMRAGLKPANEKEQEIKDHLKAHNLPDTPANRDLARQEIIRRNADIKASAALPYSEQKIRLQNSLSEANTHLNQINADSLQRGEKADELQLKEDERHNLRVTSVDSARNALDSADTNELAANIAPLLVTLTSTTEQGVKRLNRDEFDRYKPAGSGSFLRWAETHADKFAAGEIPADYEKDVAGLLDNMTKEEEKQHDANTKAITDTVRHGGITPVVNKSGRATKTEKSGGASDNAPVHKVGDKVVQNGHTFTDTAVDANGKVTGAN